MIGPDALAFPVSYVQIAREICNATGRDADRFLSDDIGLSRAQLDDPQASISGSQFCQLMVFTADFVTDNPSHQRLLVDFFPPTIHGYIALAAMTSATVRNAVDVALRYAHQVMPAFEMGYTEKGDVCHVTFRRIADLGDCNALLTEMVFCALHSFLRLFGRDSAALSVSFTHAPLILSDLPNLYPNLDIRTGEAVNQVTFAAHHLDATIATRNEATHKVIEEALQANEKRLAKQHSLAYQVSGIILTLLKQQLPVEAQRVADQLSLSSRTLSRRLAEEGQTFRQLYNDCRSRIASELLIQSRLSVAQVSEQLGFSDEANFSRFFKQQTGQSPAQFRKQQLAPPG